MPGFWDEHVHFDLWAEHSRRLDVAGATSAREVAAVVRDAIVQGKGNEPLVLVGFRDALWPDTPHRDLLDAVAGDRIVVAISGDLHCGWLNGAALRWVGLGDHPTGVLREEEVFSLPTHLEGVETATRDQWAMDAARAAAARGVVGIVDMGAEWNQGGWLRRSAAEPSPLRVECGFYPEDLSRAITARRRTGDPVEDDPLIAVGPFKVISDGSLNTRTAWCFDPYPGLSGPEACGLVTVPMDQLVPLMGRAAEAGLTPAVHAIGDRANAMVLDAFETVGCAGRIEHAQLMRWVDVDRLARLGLVASVQPEHAVDDRDVADHHWAGRTDRAYPLASFLQRGVRLAFGSDAPVAPLDPWIGVAAAVSRTRGGRDPWHPEQRIDVRQAIRASARGRLIPELGMAADLQLVELDPLKASAQDLRTMPVAATLVNGRATWWSL
jgi:predicted amidohydrolase YtcJ